MSTYSPTPVELGDITIPADGEDVDAASVNVALEAIADGVAHLASLGMKSKTFTSDGTWNSPANCGLIGFVEMFGGGGGGAGGGRAGTTNTDSGCGGGGGAGAQRVLLPVVLAASTAYAVDVGAGGTGGAVETSGFDGATSSFGTIAYARGGGGGVSTADVPAGSGAARANRGGAPCELTSAYHQRVPVTSSSDFVQTMFGAGGAGFNATVAGTTASLSGNRPLTAAAAVAGGTGGNHGSTTGGYLGGGGGGGGGAGPEGNGANGGAGGNGNNAGVGGTGTAGSAASANTGAGGGGGGCGGQGTSAGTSGIGGAGGSGKVTVYYFGDAT